VRIEPTAADIAEAERIVRPVVRPHHVADIVRDSIAQALADARAEGYAQGSVETARRYEQDALDAYTDGLGNR
jgi:hypothetical protein